MKDIAERRFAWLLKQRCYRYWTEDQLEHKIKVKQKRPDFYVETHESDAFLAEVESFVVPASPKSRQAMARDVEPILRRMRTAVRHAAQIGRASCRERV